MVFIAAHVLLITLLQTLFDFLIWKEFSLQSLFDNIFCGISNIYFHNQINQYANRKKSNQTEEPNLNDPEQRKDLKIEEALVKNESLAPIDKWIDIIQAKETRMKERQQQSQASDSDTPKDANCDRVISMGLNWLAEFEPHPDPEECGGIDYAALYR